MNFALIVSAGAGLRSVVVGGRGKDEVSGWRGTVGVGRWRDEVGS